MVSFSNVSFSYGYEPVFEQVNFLVASGKKVGIVGPNGAGKSTLFKLLTKQEFPSTGRVEVVGNLTMVPQEVKNDPALSVAKDIEEYVDPMHVHGKHEFSRILDGLEFDWKKATSNLSELSGGQKTKLALTRAFLSQPDILLLDEPTNFLDEAGAKWVMNFLGNYTKTVLVVSHDLNLLDRHIQQVLFVNPHTHTIETYTGNYSSFVKTKKEKDAELTRRVKNEQQHIKRMEEGVKNLRKKTSEKGVRQRVMLEKRIQRIKDVLPDLPPELKTMKIKFPEPQRVGELPIRAEHIYKSYGNTPILTDINLFVKRGERVALIGPNGVGKTTLIKILTGEIQADRGTVIPNENLNVGYYSQEFQTFDESLTLEQVVSVTCKIPPYSVYSYLRKFLFPQSRMHQHIATLSGGEKTRLSIALLMLQSHNLLILDEPTTYLDVLSQRVILEALKGYTGAMLIVSHTKEFVTELAPQRALILPQNKTVFWSNEYAERVTLI